MGGSGKASLRQGHLSRELNAMAESVLSRSGEIVFLAREHQVQDPLRENVFGMC